MAKKPKNRARGVSRRDFLARASALSAAAAVGPKIALASAGAPEPAPEGSRIARLGIYPAMGICRVGNSKEWFLAPEIPGQASNPEGGYKDGEMKIKKQVQRFRIYGFDDEGRVVREITGEEADIRWTVRVANTKAAWYGFNNPLDNREVAPGLPSGLRNQFFTEADRDKMLVIDPGPATVSGPRATPKPMVGRFWNELEVKLGELRTDEASRLLVFPGDGVSQSAIPDNPIDNFSDNDGWHDDWCDGWVKAEVKLHEDDRELPVDHAWVACCGPNFAPEVPPFITLYEVIQDVMVENKVPGAEAPPFPLSFRRDIYPFFHRLGLMAWVATSAATREGWIDVGNFLDPGYIARLADPSPDNADFRRHVFRQFRRPASLDDCCDHGADEVQYKLPYMLGDGVNYDFSPAHWFQIPKLQYGILASWAAGDFVDDRDDPRIDKICTFEDIPLSLQPHALTRAALDPCSGGAFHPGVELTWPLRHIELYSGPFRIALGDRDTLTQYVGGLLTPKTAFEGGCGSPPPIGPQMPGDLTRWMGIPWQCDAFSCQQVLFSNDFPDAVWWPALLPIDVLPQAYYNQVLREDLSPDVRRQFADGRVSWSRGVAGIGYHAEASYTDGLGRMVALWDRMGFVVRKPGPKKPVPGIPDELFVEMGRGSMDLETNQPPNQGIPPAPGSAGTLEGPCDESEG